MKRKKLALKRKTIRTLSVADLDRVAAGAEADEPAPAPSAAVSHAEGTLITQDGMLQSIRPAVGKGNHNQALRRV